jgi:hypothetical protein
VVTGGVSFSPAYVDQYIPETAQNRRRPEALPPRHYRNILADGGAWNVSTSAEKCSPVMYPADDASAAGGMQIRYRRWCGHAEILKYGNAQLRLLECSAAGTVSMQGITMALTDLASEATKKTGRVEYIHEIIGNTVAEVKFVINAFWCKYEMVREGSPEKCKYCLGAAYTQDCGPTYLPELGEPAQAGEGRCATCDKQCPEKDNFFAVSRFSCWSNYTTRVSDSAAHGSLEIIAARMATSKNYWYKPALCVPCPQLSEDSVPRIVTRCGNKAWFEVWDRTLRFEDARVVERPRRRFCCALKNAAYMDTTYDDNVS